jgi:hypothetical protein
MECSTSFGNASKFICRPAEGALGVHIDMHYACATRVIRRAGLSEFGVEVPLRASKMKAVSTRIKNGLLLLIALCVFGASSQAAVCELTCALLSQPGGCHGTAGASQGLVAMDMSRGHCSESMPAGAGCVKSRPEGNCSHPFVLSLEKRSAGGIQFADMQWAVVEVLPVPTALPEPDGTASKSPPLRLAGAHFLVVSLRV